jgi:hypothetical protein
MDRETEQLQILEDSVISAILTDIDKKLPQVPKRKLTKEEIATKAHLNVPTSRNKTTLTFFTGTKK